MEKDIGKIKKNDTTDVVVRIDDFGGRPGVTIREFTTSERYSGFTKSGTRIPADKFLEFREMINTIKIEDLKADSSASASSGSDKKSPSKAEDFNEEEVEDY